jgi:transposase-like protein
MLYLHGLSSGDFVPALEHFLGGTAGLSPATVTRLTKQWGQDHAAFQARDLSDRDFVYVWADGVHPKVRLGQAHSCVLVLLGVRVDGTKELIAIAEGLRESTESWADLLRDCRRRGMRDPELVVGDGAMGLWKAPAEVFPAARHQRCWVHKARNVTNALPRSAQPGATKAMQEIYNAEDRAHAEKAIDAFAKTYGAKWPKAVAKIADDREELLAFYDFPAEHWIHLRTTNPIWVLYFCHRPGSSYPGRRSKRVRPDSERDWHLTVALDSKCRTGPRARASSAWLEESLSDSTQICRHHEARAPTVAVPGRGSGVGSTTWCRRDRPAQAQRHLGGR